ncbi:DUF262 domain-containing protein [Aliarcobacter butzleri]|uniref:DUF262 domain-containing protein n=1 Tax=Aliarcobacter TaxID=2321111 RepID=UPI0021B1FB2E|nr:DUF262 domain-containing protein [Aliarcobacter butzleri]MCT7633039.1 DUF262 domain-containing protein [Aliarcobacter butzleri]
MKNNRYTFWKLLDENIIEIPIIQRDYAQGRVDEKRIRDKFLDALCEAIADETKSINLDFVYGEIKKEGENKKLTPLDGQQRLTTLFLLHWYLATKEDKLSEAGEKLQKFTYETRDSSREFCKALATNKIYFSKEDEKISNIIEDKNWFFKSWKKDPTIKSMLSMLDTIHEKFKNSDDLFDKLICENNPPITFDFLPLNEFKLTDELYVKMNARGKPLTLFENFKAEFEIYIETTGDSKEVIAKNKASFDNEWLNIFWNLAKKKVEEKQINIDEAPKLADEMFYNFFYNITFNFYLEKQDKFIKINNKEYSIINEFIKDNDIFSFYKDVYSDTNKTTVIINILNKLQIDETFETFVNNIDISQWDRARFHALQLAYIYDLDEKEFNRWKRVSFNLINNQLIQSPDDLIKTIKSLNSFIEKSNKDIYEHIKKDYKVIDYFTQKDEESLKAKLILENQNWEEEIVKAECHWYLDGQIWFLLEFTENNLEKFVMYRDKFVKLWCLAKDDKKQNLIQRALLAKNDYTTLNSRDHLDKYSLLSFGIGLREKNENWRRVFKDKLFKAFLDNLDFNNIENSLKEIINSFKFDCTDWRSFIINPDKEWHILDGIKKGHFKTEGNNIFLNAGNTDATSWGWSRVAELKNYYTYAYFKNNGFEEVVEEKLKQEIKLEYYSSSEPKDVCFYFDIKHDDKVLAVNIKFDTGENKYIFRTFYRSPHEELRKIILDFTLCNGDNELNDLKALQEEIIKKIDNILST